MSNHNPIGVFDSGLGGLTVVKELLNVLPHESIIYFGDTARVPYGTKSKETIIRFSQENTKVLLKYRVKMVVVACNSCSSYALGHLRKMFRVPIVGVIEPGASKAVYSTRNNKVGIIATQATIRSDQYPQTIKQFQKDITIFSKACPLFVPLVEEGWLDKKVTVDVAQEYLAELKSKDIDTLILGCTHYPLLKNILHQVMGNKVTLIDSAQVVALEVKRLLQQLKIECDNNTKPKHQFLISDRPQEFKRIASKFLGRPIKKVDLIAED